VRVSADINYDTLTRSDEKYDPDGQVVTTQTKQDQTTDTSTTANTTPVGITSNTEVSTNAGGNAPLNNSQNHTTTSTINYDVGKTTSNLVETAGGIRRLSASVSIAAIEQGTNGDQKVVPRTADQLDKLRSIVASAVGIDTSRGDTIAVEELPFNNEFATEVTQELDQQQKQNFWWELARNATYPALAIAVFLVLLRLLNRTPVQDIPLGVPVGRLLATQNGNGNGNGHGPASRIGDAFETPPGVVTVEVLNRLIKENPANMTQAIRDWMNKGRSTEQN
jgi:flagellar biosynthesis/type III secretory pathway M-ring protein FliF/YscJ